MRREKKEEKLLLYLREGLEAMESPDGERKKAFLRSLPAGPDPRTGTLRILLQQCAWIPGSVWLAAGLLFVLAALTAPGMGEETVWILAACLPFLALTAELAAKRSFRYGMAELEASSVFSLQSVLFARFVIIGVAYLLLILALSLLIGSRSEAGPLLILPYLLVPYLLTMTGALLLERSAAGRKAPHLPSAFAILVSGSVLTARQLEFSLLKPENAGGWWIAAVFLLGAEILLFCKNIRTEEAVILWN